MAACGSVWHTHQTNKSRNFQEIILEQVRRGEQVAVDQRGANRSHNPVSGHFILAMRPSETTA